MTLLKDLPLNQVICGDAFEVLQSFPDNSIDCVVTDPPYGIGFMGKEWDKALPPQEVFQQVFRVLKPGALAFVMSSPRQDVLWRMLSMLEGCGFQLRQSFVSWIYKSGFPKAYDVSKGIDKKLRRDYVRVAKRLGIIPKSLASWGDWTIREHTPSDKYWEQFKRVIPKEDWQKIEREVIGQNPNAVASVQNLYGYKMNGVAISKPSSVLAKKWQGWKSMAGLKPALECILMVNKPLGEKTIVDNVLKHGVGTINVDGCRIPIDRRKEREYDTENKSGLTGSDKGLYFATGQPRQDNWLKKGRFPANLLVSDKALDTGKITRRTYIKKEYQQNRSGDFLSKLGHSGSQGYNDIGDQSRFFDLDAWARHHGFLDVVKASKQERDKGLTHIQGTIPKRYGEFKGTPEHAPNRQNPQKNIHPTVKPVKLMAYLIELGCPQDGVVLDPFVGSGTTCIAAHQLGRKWIGIEINEDYVKIAKHRIATLSKWLTNFTEKET